jgi:hypothetical protein
MDPIQDAPDRADYYRGTANELLNTNFQLIERLVYDDHIGPEMPRSADFPEANKFISSKEAPQMFNGGEHPQVDGTSWVEGFILSFGAGGKMFIYMPWTPWTAQFHKFTPPLILVVGDVPQETQDRAVRNLSQRLLETAVANKHKKFRSTRIR